METDALLKLLANGGAVSILGGICAWLLGRTIPSLEATFRASLDKVREAVAEEMAAQRRQQDQQNERLIQWLSKQADLPDYRGGGRDDRSPKP